MTRLAFEKLGQICQGLEHQWQVEAGQALASEGSSVWLTRRQWIILLTIALSLSDRCRKKHIKDFVMACAIREHRRPMIILFGGTSGCGKSTLASLTASRLGITTVLSTDFVRHLLRREFSKQEAPILYASTYNAGEALDAQVLGAGGACSQGCGEDVAAASRRVLQGYQEQSGFIFDRLARVIASYEERREPLIVEGVHLSMDAMAELMKRHASAIGFMVYISNADKHRERFAVRAKYMALDQRSNRYIKFFDNIRLIQSSQAQEADKILIPKIDNTNVDRSLATIHAIVIKCLRKHYKGRLLWDSEKRQAVYMRKAMEEHQEDAWSSKAMLRTIRSKISKGEVLRRYFADAPGDDSSAGLDSPGRPIQDLSDKSLPASPPSPLRECEAPVPEGACGPAARVHAGIDTRPSRLGGGGHEPGGPPRAAAGQDIQGALQHAALDTAPRVPGIGQEDEVEAGAQVEQGKGKSSGANELGPGSIDRKSFLGAGGRTHAATTHEQAPSKASEEHVADPAPPDLGPNSPPAPVAADMSDSWGGDADRFGVDALGTTREPLAPAPPAVAGATWGLADSSLAVGGGGVRRKARPRGGRGKGPPGQQSSLFLQMRLQVVQETGVLEGGGYGRDGESVGVQSRMQSSGRSLCSSRERAPPQDAQSCGPSRVCCDDPSETPPCVVDADHDIVSRSQQQLVQPLVSPSSSSASDEEYDDDDSLSGSDHGRGSPSTASESEGRTLGEPQTQSPIHVHPPAHTCFLSLPSLALC